MKKKMSKDDYEKEYEAFLKQLKIFHMQRGTEFKNLPKINGKGIDLYLLYVVVTAKGGWQKVNSRCEWEELLEDFRLPQSCTNSATALKHIYLRYLDAFERVNYLGEDGEERTNDVDEDDSRSFRIRKSGRVLNVVPLTYNHLQHNVTDSAREAAGMSVDLYKPSQYDQLALSLLSPLPNEHTFALNTCTILSSEGRHLLQLSKCHRLVDFLLAHAGVFRDRESQKYFLTNYKESKGRSLVQFWIDAVEDKCVLDLLNPESLDVVPLHNDKSELDASHISSDMLSPMRESSVNISFDTLKENNLSEEVRSDCSECSPPRKDCYASSKEVENIKRENIKHKLEKVFNFEGGEFKFVGEEKEFLHLGRDTGLLDQEGTRIAQILSILRNLSFEESNVLTLAHSTTCLRFLVLATCSRWGSLCIGALDMLANIASEVVLLDPSQDPTSSLLLNAVCQGVASPDRAFVLRSLEVLNKLAVNDINEEVLSDNIEQKVYDMICCYLTIHDIMLLIYTLECLYSLSSMGSAACNAIIRAKGSIHTLVSLLTVEAQSYGHNACIDMKVVETFTGVITEGEPTPTSLAGAAQTTQTSVASATSGTATAVTSTATTTVKPLGPGPSNLVKPLAPKLPTPNDAKKVVSKIVPPEVEDFVIDWVKKNYEPCSGNAIEQATVYRHFQAAMYALGRKQGLNPVLLSNCVRKLFGTGVGPCRRPVDEGLEKWHYTGIRRKDGQNTKKPTKIVNSSFPQLAPTPVISPAVASIQSQPPHKPQNSSLIKSLLASKVSRNLQKNSVADTHMDKVVVYNGVYNEVKSEETSQTAVNDKEFALEIIQNGIKNEIDIKDEPVVEPQEFQGKKNVLADLLEKTVGGDILNGVVEERELQDKTEFKQKRPLVPCEETVGGGIKRTAAPNDLPAKRLAIDGTSDGRMTLYVSQNGTESTPDIVSQSSHQVILNQGQQQVMVTPGGQVVTTSQAVVTPQGQVILQQRPVISHGGQIIGSSGAGQVIHQVIQHTGSNTPQKVILHHGQIIGGQVILSQGGQQVVVQNTSTGQILVPQTAQGQPVIVHSSHSPSQFVVNSQPQTVVVTGGAGNQVVGSNSQTQQAMLVASNQGQVVVNSNQGHPVVASGGQAQGASVVVHGAPNTVFVAPQQPGASKAVIIWPNSKMVLTSNQQQGTQVVLPRPLSNQQVISVVTSSSAPTSTTTLVCKPSRPSTDGATSHLPNSTLQNSVPIAPAPAGPAAVPVSQSSSSPQNPPPAQAVVSGTTSRSRPGLQYMCEWRGCNQLFQSPGQVYHHACKVHCPASVTELECQWSGCDTMVRKRFSAMTHIQDRHCNEQLMQLLALRRQQIATKGKADIPVPQAPPPHPGYAPNAAFHAIKRHALDVITQRDIVENEGPVTKSIRLTSALILRNLVIYSNSGKKLLKGYESELANVALSSMESSRTIAQVLYDINLSDSSQQGVLVV